MKKLIVEIEEEVIDKIKNGELPISVFNACVYAVENGKPLQKELEEINVIAYEIVGAEIRRVGLDMYNSKDERAEDYRKAYNLINECCGGIFNKKELSDETNN